MFFSQNEKQLLAVLYGLAANNILATKDMVYRGGHEFFKNGLLNLESAFQPLTEKKLITDDNDIYMLIHQGSKLGADFLAEFSQKGFNKGLGRFEQSAAFAKFCTELYGRNLGQINLLTEIQLQKILASLREQKPEIVLDLGCGIGKITEYLSEEVNASFIGLDYAEDAIIEANARNSNKSNIEFIYQDFNQLNLPENSFDAVICIDSLYFVNDLEIFIEKLIKLLKSEGKLYLFFSSAIDIENLSPDKYSQVTKLAKILTGHNLKYEATDYSIDEFVYWNNVLEVGEPLKAEFVIEGTVDLIDQVLSEARLNLEPNALLRVRFLYIVSN